MRGWIIVVVCALASCKTYTFSLDNRPCDEQRACLAGYVCSPVTSRCVLAGSAQDCTPANEIACNGIDEDCDGADLVASGTVDNCGGCNDSCRTAFVAEPACVSLQCAVVRCDVGHVDQDQSAANGCERVCPNADGDGLCDDEDTCLDKDGDRLGTGHQGNAGCASTTSDSNDDSAATCADTDNDGCDDCASGTFAPLMDGVDQNGNGKCNVGEPDEDGDGVAAAAGDPDDNDPNVCGSGEDSCDDCALGPPAKPANDGTDTDGDGQCDASDPDDDNDTVADGPDTDAVDRTKCQDLDDDGCDDCTAIATYGGPNMFDDGPDVDRDGMCYGADATKRDCDDGIPTCTRGPLCDDDAADPDSVPECTEIHCTSTFGASGVTGATCYVATNSATFTAAINAMNARTSGPPTYILLGANLTLTGEWPLNNTDKIVLHQRAGTTFTADYDASNGAVFSVGTPGNEFHGLHLDVLSTSNIDAVFEVTSNDNVIVGNQIDAFANRGIFVNGTSLTVAPSGNLIAHNTLRGGRGGLTQDASTTGGIVIRYGINTRIFGNTLVGTAMAALNIGGGTNTSIDHNTFFMRNSGGAEGPAMSFFVFNSGDLSSDTCARNNLIAMDPDASPAFMYEAADATSWKASCSAGNVIDAPAGARCDAEADGAGVQDCGTFPAGFFSALSFAPSMFRQTTAPSTVGYLCLGPSGATAATGLIDNPAVTAVAPSIDLNGAQANDYNGARPEPGSKEHRAPWCP